MTRLFTFGCSYTLYCWPTWADLLGLKFDEYQNWAQSGGGNRFIFERLVEANTRHKFTAEDIIIVQWTTHQRHDYYREGWWAGGNIFSSEHFDHDYIDKYFDIKASVMHSLNYISAAQQLLDNTSANWYMTSLVDLTIPLPEYTCGASDEYKDINNVDHLNSRSIFVSWPALQIYEPILEGDRWLSTTLNDWCDSIGFEPGGTSYALPDATDHDYYVDWHPGPPDHYSWLQQVSKTVPVLTPSTDAQNIIDQWNSKFDRKKVIASLSHKWIREIAIRPKIFTL